MSTTVIDRNSNNDIMTPEEAAKFLKKSTSWVYKNWKKLKLGRKLGGSLIFSRAEIYQRLFEMEESYGSILHQRERKMEVRFFITKERGT